MGDETIEFASRFSRAVGELADLVRDDGYARLAASHGASLPERVLADLEAIEAVFETGTKAVRNWAERRRRVLALLGAMRDALGRSGIDAALRRMARDLIEAMEPGRDAGQTG